MTSFLDRLFGRPEPRGKAVTAVGGWTTAVGSLVGSTPQNKTAAYLRAYKVGWFYKAGKKIADDIASLDWSVSDGDMEEGEDETTMDRPELSIPFENLGPIDQFQRLLERPNPNQTGRQLFRKTQVRLDFAGCAAWYLEGASFGLPTALYGISPARMWPSRDKSGELIGWVMDKDAPSGGVPFNKDEILWFSTGNADDDDLFGTGVVEAVYGQVPLTEMMARHTVNVLATGGRLAGMLSPKDRALSPDEFDDAVRSWRNIASDPDAARRLLIFPEPMEYTPGASTPAEIGIPELAILTRDEILTAFPVSPYRLGVPTPGGLNSGEVRREDRRDYWEETIHPRADLLEENIQVGLLSRYEDVLGQTFNFEMQEPNLDDAPSLIEKVGAFKGLVSVGFDPKEAVAAVGLEGIKWVGLPDLIDPAKQAALAEAAAARPAVQPPAKAVKTRPENVAQTEIARFLTEQRDRITARVIAGKSSRKAEPTGWWDGELEDAELRATLRSLYLKVGREALQEVADNLGRVVLGGSVNRVLSDLVTYGGDRITNINETTRLAVQTQITEGVRRGYSIPQLVGGVPAEGFAGVQNALLDNGVAAFDPYRAEVISRTETALSYNRAAIRGYDQFGVKEVEAIDGDGDLECAARNGLTFSVEDALAIEDHPNGTLDWVPVLA